MSIPRSANGTMTETCVFTFTPVGQQIQEVQNCTVSMGGSQVTTTLVAVRVRFLGILHCIALPCDPTRSHPCTGFQTSSTASPTAAAAFVMPGTTIQVLPIGLGVYGGITFIAVLVVAYVTWERVQYRKVCSWTV